MAKKKVEKTEAKKENKGRFKKLFRSKKIIVSTICAIIFLAVTSAALAYWYFNRGYSFVEENEVRIAEVMSAAHPGDSYITGDKIIPQPYYITYNISVFNPEFIGKTIETGATIYPNIKGEWKIAGDRAIMFNPSTDWIPGTKYKVSLDSSLFGENVKVKEREFTFLSPNFKASVTNESFYEDPRDTKLKQAIATFSFNYPFDKDSVKDNIKIVSVGGENYGFTYKTDEMNTKVYVMSEALKIKKDEDFVEIKIKGIKNAYNNEPMGGEAKAKIKIPSYSTFFKLNNVSTQIIYNENNNNNPEQVLFVGFSTSVNKDMLRQYFHVFKYDIPCYQVREKLSKKTDPEKIKSAQKIELKEINSDVESSKTHMFKYDIEKRNTCLVAKINKGLSSTDDFILSNDETRVLEAANYPLQANIGFSGSIISLQGEKTLSFTSRGVNKLEVEIARIGINDVNHLITQTSGDFSHPYFRSYSFDEDNISEIFKKDLPINMEHSSQEIYSSLDLGKYFKDKRGIFIVKARGALGDQNHTSYDRRLIVITDLGVIVKDNSDKTHDVFVSSFNGSHPIHGAKVELLGKNGQPVLTSFTNNEGYASFPDYSGFTREKEPVVYLISKDNDVSYIPVNKSDRKLDVSRFDVDGVYMDSSDNEGLSGFAFSDRGIYRPGEDARFGIIIRQNDLNVPNKIPLQISIRNPNGDEVASSKLWSDEYGFFDYQYSVPKTARIGDYYLYIYEVHDQRQPTYINSISFRVEEFTPDNMKIKLTLENSPSKGWYTAEEIRAAVNLQNLYGNPAAHHRVAANYYLSPTSFSFKEYKDYVFKDPLRSDNSYIRSHSESLPDAETNEEGNAEFVINMSDFDRGTYKLTFNISGYELDSGRSVGTSSQMLISPNEYLVGYRGQELGYIYKDAKNIVDFIAVDSSLNQIEKSGLTKSVFAIKYISTLVEMPNGTYRYQMVEKQELVSTEAYTISQKGSELILNTETAGEFFVELKDKDTVVAKVHYTVVGSSNTGFKVEREAILDMKLNKSEYNHSDTIRMQLKAPYEGYGLITIEQDKVYAYKWFRASSKVSEQTIELPNTVEGNAYVNVAFIRSSGSKEIFASPLSYSVQPFSINKDKRRVMIELGTPEKVKPGEELVIKYKTSEPARIVVYGVNEGILQVAKYKLPDPLSFFMKKRALRVATFQIMDLIMPEIKIVRNLKAAGGDDSEAEDLINQQLNPFARKQNEVVAFWSGVLEASKKEQEYVYKVPETFNGQITVMAVGVTEQKFGNAEDKVLVRGDFALYPSGPFNVSPNDIFEVGTSVANLVEGSGDSYEINVELLTTEGLEVIGEKVQTISLKERGEKSIRFRVKALNQLGSQTLTFKAYSTKDNSKISKMPYHIGIRPSSPFTVDLDMGYEPSKLKLKNFVEPMFAEFRTQKIEASTSPLVIAQSLLAFLDSFPHSCTEQTVSKVYPAMTVFFNYPDLVKDIDVYGLYDKAISALSQRQNIDGGFSAWNTSNGYADEFASVYATEFLVNAKKQNFNVPYNLLEKAIKYNKEVAGRMPQNLDDVNPAYAIYILTMSGETTTNYLINLENFLKENYKKEWKSSLSAAYMSASYKLLQDEAKARSILGSYKLGKKGNTINDARYIYLMAAHFPEDFMGVGEKGLKALLEPLKTRNFTTISSAYSLLALNAYENNKENDKKITFNGKSGEIENFATRLLSDEDKEMTIKSPNSFFYSVRQQGFLKDQNPKEIKRGIEVYKEYFNKDGKSVKSAKLGDEIIIRIKVKSLRQDYINDVAIVDLIPGCFEIKSNSISSGYATDYSEEREDRALIYLTVGKDVQEISYIAKVIAKGEFIVPPVYANALYDATIRSNSKASGFVVEE